MPVPAVRDSPCLLPRSGLLSVPSVQNPKLTSVLPVKTGVGQKLATHVSPTSRNLFVNFDLYSPFIFILFRNPLLTF